MTLGIIGLRRSRYTGEMLESLLDAGIKPQYVIVEDTDEANLALSACLLSNSQMPDPCDEGWNFTASPDDILYICRREAVPFFCVDEQNGPLAQQILVLYPLDILLITEGPIFRGRMPELPRVAMLNIHAAPLPCFRGNWTTLLSLYNDYPPVVSAHVVVNEVDMGPLVATMPYEIFENDDVDDINRRAWQACKILAVKVLKDAEAGSFSAQRQRLWEGKTYKGHRAPDGTLKPAMPLELQQELEKRLSVGRYGFYTRPENKPDEPVPAGHGVTIAAERLLLRPLRVSDAPAMYNYTSIPSVSRFLLWRPHTSVQQDVAFIKNALSQDGHGVYHFAVALPEKNDELIGCVCVYDMNERHGRCEISYILNPRYSGRGYASEAVSAVIRWLVQQGYRRVQALCVAENIASENVMKRCGMVYEGTFERYIVLKDKKAHAMKIYAFTSEG